MHAQYELGMDYLKAGLLDRAEETFNLLVDTQYSVQARRALLEIYPARKGMDARHRSRAGLQESGAGAPAKGNRPVLLRAGAGCAGAHCIPDAALAMLDKAVGSRPQERARHHADWRRLAGQGRHRRRADGLAPRRAAKRAARGAGGARA